MVDTLLGPEETDESLKPLDCGAKTTFLYWGVVLVGPVVV